MTTASAVIEPAKKQKSDLNQIIEDSIRESLPAESNRKVTAAHYVLSEALQEAIGEDAGPNFHSWAVWGSKKAGVTIRQEDLESALKNAAAVSGIVGFVVGTLAAAAVIWFLLDTSALASTVLILLGGALGAFAGAMTGRAIARYSRAEAARLILEGNQTVLEDIGGKTAQFVSVFKNKNFDDERFSDFERSFREGKTSANGQNLLKEAFKAYTKAALAIDAGEKRQWSCFANCLIILHEHIRLQPYISKSLPFIIRRCVTQRMMTFEVGEISLSVAREFADAGRSCEPVELSEEQKKRLVELMKLECRAENISFGALFDETGSYTADNWTRIEQRMRYVWRLFGRFHLEPQVRAKPF